MCGLGPAPEAAGAGLFFLLADKWCTGPGGLPGRLLPGLLFLYLGDRMQQRVAHEVGEAFFAGFGGGDEATFVVGGYADRDLSRFSVFGGCSDSWIVCGFQIGRVILVLHGRSSFRGTAVVVRCT